MFKGNKIISAFLVSLLIFPVFAGSGEEKGSAGYRFLQTLPQGIPPFRKGAVRKVPGGAEVIYKLFPAEAQFKLFTGNQGKKILSSDPDTKENKKLSEELFSSFLAEKQKEIKGRITLVAEYPLTIPALAMKKVKGKMRLYQTGGKRSLCRLGRFIAFYRGNIFCIDYSRMGNTMPEKVEKELINRFITVIVSNFYEGEKTIVPQYMRQLLSKAYTKLCTTPLDAMEEAHALTSFVEKSSWVLVRIRDKDLLWHKSLLKGSLKEQRYGFLLFAAYMAGNAMKQLEEGVCADRNSAGIETVKKVYFLIREKDPSFTIPELEK